MVGQASHVAREAFHRRRVHVQCVIGRIARDHRHVDRQVDGATNSVAEAAIGFLEVLAAVVQVGELRDTDHRELLANSAWILSR